MREIVRTNDAVLLSYLTALLAGEGIDAVTFDLHASIAEGSLIAIPRRLMVRSDQWDRARDLIAAVGHADLIASDEC